MTNSYNPNQGKRKLSVYDSPAQWLAAAHTAIKNGETLMIHCSAQKTKSKWSAQNIEKLLVKAFPHLKILRTDRETVSDPTHPAFGCVQDLNIEVTKYDIVIATPTIETGVSIDVEHFDSVWCLANGVQTVDAVCQTIERVRSDIPRHICIDHSAKNMVGNGSDSSHCLLKSEHTVFKANLQQLAGVDAVAASDGFASVHLQTWAKYASKVNWGFKNYKQNILDKLVSEGYELIAPDSQSFTLTDSNEIATEEIETAIAIAKTENYHAEREEKINVPNPCDIKLAELKKKIAKTRTERYQEAKGNLCRRYLTENITHDLIIKDDDGLYPQLQFHYYLTIGYEHLKGRDIAKIKELSPDGGYPNTLAQ